MAHKSPTAKDRVAIAPYNFVSLPDEIALPPQDLENYNQGFYEGHSGYIDLGFRVLSPLYIRGMMTPEEYLKFGKKKIRDIPQNQREKYLKTIARFFSYNKHRRIPGSSLRGLFRTIIEVISFSKPYEITDKRIKRPGKETRNKYYNYSPKQLMPDYITQIEKENESGGNSERKIEEVFDLSELMFGFVRKSGNNTFARGGRVFFEDGIVINPVNEKERTPKILGTPKPSAYPIYLEQSSPDNPYQLCDYDVNKPDTQIRGNKFYWSQGPDPNWWVDNVAPNLETRITPIYPKAEFISRIRFENLTDVELGSLLWVIDLGQRETHCLRLGMAKPYGLGAVRIFGSNVNIIDRSQRYQQSVFTKGKDLDQENKTEPFDHNNEEVVKEIALEIKAKLIKDQKVIDSYIDKFKNWVKEEVLSTDQTFEDNIRIKELEKLHEWIGYEDPKRKYMTLDQYGDNRVLPNPLDVDKILPDFLDTDDQNDLNFRQESEASEENKKNEKKRQIDLTIPIGEKFSIGKVISVRIADLSDSELFFCEYPGLHDNQAFVIKRIHATNIRPRPIVGNIIRCRVDEIVEDEEEEITYIYLQPTR